MLSGMDGGKSEGGRNARVRARGGSGLDGRARQDSLDDKGRLILVVCSDAGRLDLVLTAVSRRFGHDPRVAFMRPIATRQMPAGGGVAVSRNGFAALERIGGVVLGWRNGGAAYGHCVSLLARLAAGEIVVAGAGADLAPEARAIWPDVRLVHLAGATDSARAGLTPRACLSRLTGRPAALGRLLADDADERVADRGDLPETVLSLSDAIRGLVPAPGTHRAVKPQVPRGRRA